MVVLKPTKDGRMVWYAARCTPVEKKPDGFEQVRGHRVEVLDGVECFVYCKVPYWFYVCEALTGYAIERGDSVREAVDNARARLLRAGEGSVVKVIGGRLKENGISPRYMKKARE